MNKHRLQFVSFLALVVALILMVGSVGAAPKDAPLISLSAAKNAFSALEEVLINVTFTNSTQHTLRVLKWFTPMDGIEEPVFIANVNGKPVTYTGAVYKRPAPTGSDYLTLKSGESVTYSVNLGDFYDLSADGQYRLFYKAASPQLFDEKGSPKAETIASIAISFNVEGRLARVKPTPTPTPPPGGNSFNACTVSQQNTLVKARGQAKAYTAGAKSYLSANLTGSRYTTWFGTVTAARYNTAFQHFNALSSAWDSAGVAFDCGCKQNYYAYVYPNQPYKIFLCKVFWTAPLAGTDSQGGTLIHEMSHFYVVASTNDFVYGQTGAKSLAISNPDNAVKNADNHEYFAENTPALP